MNETILSEDLVIHGLEVRTSPATAAHDIPALWGRFLARPLDAEQVYAVYCDYASDFRGIYTLVLGVAADADAPVAPGLRRVTVPAGRFARFSACGNPAEAIGRAWSEINGAGCSDRRYVADFERYDAHAMRPEYADAEVLVGLRA